MREGWPDADSHQRAITREGWPDSDSHQRAITREGWPDADSHQMAVMRINKMLARIEFILKSNLFGFIPFNE